ncbi:MULTISPECIES: hypothetical protein [unclassified Streptomyces]|uniref:hypothetical protein n=1 Tax=Streptomycetaceae TaxID=2062 RepID=UPI002E7800E8|nr:MULTISPECIES: hypothetical protein [unclassified Streptomyces]MED7947653.1 hypothetical protein [Streptomyces sp. BE303]MEE1824013.1 hypothetical protein [Streptomyces sp. BE20]
MRLIVLLEPELQRVAPFGGAADEYVEGVRAVHAAGADPSVPGAPGGSTLCGADTRRMQAVDYRPAEPGSSWYPPKWHGSGKVCPHCDRAAHTG